MDRKNIYQISLHSILCGFLYEVFYELALALRWITSEETFSFIAAAFVGVIIALIIKQGRAIKTLITTICGLVSAFAFHVLAIYLSIPWKVLVHIDPLMGDIGYMTANENITILFVSVGYLFISLFVFLITLGIKSAALSNKNNSATTPMKIE